MRSYDYQDLLRRTGSHPRQLEKVCRILNLFEDLSYVPFLKDRLSLYGGTAHARRTLNGGRQMGLLGEGVRDAIYDIRRGVGVRERLRALT